MCCHGSGEQREVRYEPAESQSTIFGGNSNWRGPVWMPINYLLIESLQKFHHYYGDDFKVECPTGSGKFQTLECIANELSNRLISLWLPDAKGNRPFAPHYSCGLDPARDRDRYLFHEYFNGDTGAGIRREPSDRLDRLGREANSAAGQSRHDHKAGSVYGFVARPPQHAGRELLTLQRAVARAARRVPEPENHEPG
jgi:hypothetical protein